MAYTMIKLETVLPALLTTNPGNRFDVFREIKLIQRMNVAIDNLWHLQSAE